MHPLPRQICPAASAHSASAPTCQMRTVPASQRSYQGSAGHSSMRSCNGLLPTHEHGHRQQRTPSFVAGTCESGRRTAGEITPLFCCDLDMRRGGPLLAGDVSMLLRWGCVRAAAGTVLHRMSGSDSFHIHHSLQDRLVRTKTRRVQDGVQQNKQALTLNRREDD